LENIGAVSKLIFPNDNGTRFYQSGWNLVPHFIGFRGQLVNTTCFETTPFETIHLQDAGKSNLKC
jgi:hypothetical protein